MARKKTNDSLFEKYRGKFKKLTKDQKGEYYAFRGQEDADWPLESAARTRMERENTQNYKDLFDYLKMDLINPTRLNGWGREGSRELYDLEILARLQHYGAATCLLDFTRSFPVALWFACHEEHNKKGRVYIINTNDVDNFRKIEMEDIKKNELEELLNYQRVWYWDLESFTERVSRQNSVLIIDGNNPIRKKPHEYFDIAHRDKKDLIKEIEGLFDLRPESLFKDIFGFASIHKRNAPLLYDPFRLGNEFYESENYDKAIEYYTKAIELGQKHADVYNNRGLAYLEKRDHGHAIKDFNEASSLAPKYADIYYNRGVAYLEMGDYRPAIKDFNEAIRLQLNSADVHNHRGRAYLRIGKHDRALEDFNKAIELKPDFAKAYNNRAVILGREGKYDRAMQNLNMVIAINPKDAIPYHNRGNAYVEKGKYDLAIADYNKAIELNPDYATAYSNRGLAYSGIKNYNFAIRDYNKAIELNPNYAIAYNNRGLAYRAKGEPDKAEADSAEAKRLGYKPPSG